MKHWYVLQIYAGYEDKIKNDLHKKILERSLQDKIGEILIPSAKMKKNFSALEEEDEQLFPGYMLVEAEMSPDVIHMVTESPRVIRFLGGKNPIKLSKKEVNRIFENVESGVTLSSEKVEFAVDSEVSIIEGPFTGFTGVVEKIDLETERLIVTVSIFGRMTPVGLRFDQVEK
jgi:transcriptional antiterminator NusG